MYVGTVVSGALANLIRPGIIYRDCFSKNVWSYFRESARYIGVVAGVAFLMVPVKNLVMGQISLAAFIAMAVIITVAYNGIFFLLFRKTQEFDYLWTLLRGKISFLKRFRR